MFRILDITHTSGWWFGMFYFHLFSHAVGNVIIPTDFHSFFPEHQLLNHQRRWCHGVHLGADLPTQLQAQDHPSSGQEGAIET